MTCIHVWKDLTQGLGETRHYYCERCKAHDYRGKIWSRQKWEAWIDDERNQLEFDISDAQT